MSKTYAQQQVLNSRAASQKLVIAIGSSITVQGLINTSSRFGYDVVGPVEWAMRFLGWPAQYLNMAVSGEFTYEIAARIDNMLALRPGIVVCQNGTNEIGTGIASIIENSIPMYDKILASGAILILQGEATRTKASSGWDDNNLRTMQAVNEFKRMYAESHDRCIYSDTNKYLIDPTNAYGEPLSDILRDGTHWTGKGAALVGKGLATILEGLLLPADPVCASVLKSDGTYNPYGNEAPNPSFAGTSGTESTGCSGDTPTGYALSRVSGTTSGTMASTIAEVGGVDPRREATLTFTPGGSTGTEEFYFATSPSNLTPLHFNSYYEALIHVNVSAWDGWKNITLEVDDQSTSQNKTMNDAHNAYVATMTSGGEMPDFAWEGWLKIPAFPVVSDNGITAAAQRFRLRAGINSAAAGTGIIKLHSPVFRAINPDSRLLVPYQYLNSPV